MSCVLNIFTAAGAGAPMVARPSVEVGKGVGIIDDRYGGLGSGVWFKVKRPVIRHLSLIQSEFIEGSGFAPEETRRNLLTQGVELNPLVGEEFLIGEIRVRGVELCTPCNRPSQLADKKGFADIFHEKGGLRVEVLTNGTITSRTPIVI